MSRSRGEGDRTCGVALALNVFFHVLVVGVARSTVNGVAWVALSVIVLGSVVAFAIRVYFGATAVFVIDRRVASVVMNNF